MLVPPLVRRIFFSHPPFSAITAAEMAEKYLIPYKQSDRFVCRVCHPHFERTGSTLGVKLLKKPKSGNGHITQHLSRAHPKLYSQCISAMSSQERVLRDKMQSTMLTLDLIAKKNLSFSLVDLSKYCSVARTSHHCSSKAIRRRL